MIMPRSLGASLKSLSLPNKKRKLPQLLLKLLAKLRKPRPTLKLKLPRRLRELQLPLLLRKKNPSRLLPTLSSLPQSNSPRRPRAPLKLPHKLSLITKKPEKTN